MSPSKCTKSANSSQNFACDICQKIFAKRFNVRRHKENVHKEQTPEGSPSVETFLCELCAHSFSSKYKLKKHLEKVHSRIFHLEDVGSGRYICDICKRSFQKSFNLRRHKGNVHKIEIPTTTKDPYMCDCCGLSFTKKQELIEHLKQKSSHRKIDEEKRKKLLTCPYPECRQTTSNYAQLRSHYKLNHRKDMSYKTITFSTEQQFFQWKEEIEKEMRCTFGKKSFKRMKNGRILVRLFRCNRSGVYEPRVIRKRKPRRFGSRKINGYCPAEMKVCFKKTKIFVKYLPVHVGHDNNNNFSYMNMSTLTRSSIMSQLTRGVPRRNILGDIKQPPSSSKIIEKGHASTYKDVYNTETKFGIQSRKLFTKNDAQNVAIWCEVNKEMIVFLKKQNSRSASFPTLRKDDFVLVFRSEKQRTIFRNFGQNIISVDSVNGFNSDEFSLTTVTVVGNNHQGLPVIFMFSNRTDEEILSVFFNIIKKDIGDLQINTFISDRMPKFYNSWCEVFLKPKYHLYSIPHVFRDWRAHLNNVSSQPSNFSNEEIRNYKKHLFLFLRRMTLETNVDVFNNQLNEFLRHYDHIQDFHQYFKSFYVLCVEKWAHCYRIKNGVDTNTISQSFHKVLKHSVLNGQKLRCLESPHKALHAICEYLDREMEKELMDDGEVIKEKLKNIRSRHKASLAESLENIENDSENTWIIESLKSKKNIDTQIYNLNVIQRRYKTCTDDCKLTCQDCKICLHEYTCTCVDFQICDNFCKHIHLLCRFLTLQCYDNYIQEEVCEYIEIPFIEDEQPSPHSRYPDCSDENEELIIEEVRGSDYEWNRRSENVD